MRRAAGELHSAFIHWDSSNFTIIYFWKENIILKGRCTVEFILEMWITCAGHRDQAKGKIHHLNRLLNLWVSGDFWSQVSSGFKARTPLVGRCLSVAGTPIAWESCGRGNETIHKERCFCLEPQERISALDEGSLHKLQLARRS